MELEQNKNTPSSPAPARLRVEVGNRIFLGDAFLPELAFRARVSDVLNDPDRRFLPLANVSVIDPVSGQAKANTAFLLVRIEAIDVVIPIDEPGLHASLD